MPDEPEYSGGVCFSCDGVGWIDDADEACSVCDGTGWDGD